VDFFKRYYSGVDFEGKEEVKVHCPFHDDTHESASINTDKGLFQCWVCKKGFNELGFIAEINQIPLIEAAKVLNKLEDYTSNQWGIIEKAELWSDTEFLNKVRNLGISDEIIEQFNLGLVTDYKSVKMLGIPIYYNGVLMDVKRYNLLKIPNIPKIVGNADTEQGLIFPFDVWKSDKEKTYIMEGEKDTIAGRAFGINSITLTGGAGTKPNELVLPEFKDREVVICYDNDEAGRSGAISLYKKLRNYAKSVRYINISDIVKEEKEDFYDAVHKYEMDIFTFKMLEEREFDLKEVNDKKHYTPIKRALAENIIKKPIKSIINVSAEFSEFYALPIVATIEKVASDGSKKGNSVDIGTKKSWFFDKTRHLEQLLELVEINARKSTVEGKIKTYVGMPQDERGVSVKVSQYETIYKYKIIDSNAQFIDGEEFDNTNIDLYAFNKLNVGTEYDISYIIFPHPEKHQKLIAVTLDIYEMNAEKDFAIQKDLLFPLTLVGTVEQRVDKLYQSAKHHIAKHLNYNMWLMEDLVFNSILEFDYGVRTWGALDVFILGDTATGKSESSKGLVNLYNFGHFLSLKTSTTIGLIGGSKKDGDGMINTIGAIPRQHRKLVVMEEFSGADPSFIKTMTDVRTTRRVHIVRVAGELDVACNLRMITISNPIGDERGLPKYLATFPNGVLPLMELINNPEDVGRYDGYLLIPQVTARFNPFNHPLQGHPIPKESYEHKAQWVFTRKPKNVIYEEGVEGYIWERAEELNASFESNFPLFGTKASLKLARFSVALASLILNVDESFENIIVTKDIVDFVVKYFYAIYDNSLFKLKDYKTEYDEYNTCKEEDILELQNLYPKNSNFIDYLESTSVTSLDNLRANSGYDSKEFNTLYSKLSHMKFIRSLGKSIIPTTKFRKAVKQIDKNFTTGTGSLDVKRVTHTIKE
jgi:5S rRNA maturation endonuclease (ribonuclease M5)